MTTKIHGVLGGPRQKVSQPRTKVDLSNMISSTSFEGLSDIETVVLSRDDKADLIYSKFEEVEEQQYQYSDSEDDITVESISVDEDEEEEILDEDTSSSTEPKTIDEWLLKLSGKSD